MNSQAMVNGQTGWSRLAGERLEDWGKEDWEKGMWMDLWEWP